MSLNERVIKVCNYDFIEQALETLKYTQNA